MKKLCCFVFAICMFMGIFQITTGIGEAKDEAAKPIKWKALSFLPTNLATCRFLGTLCERVTKESDGEFVLEWTGGPEVISSNDQIQAVKSGVIDMTATCTIYYASQIPEGALIQISKLSPSEERETGFHDWMVQLHWKKLNCYYLGRAMRSPYYLFSKNPVQKPQDLSGKSFAGFSAVLPLYKALGISSTYVSVGETYSALERGLATGFCLPASDAASLSMPEVCKYMVDHPFYEAQNVVFLINGKSWKNLPKRFQEILNKVQKEMEPEMVDFFKKESEKGRQRCLDGGMQAIQFSPEDAKWFIETANTSFAEAHKKDLSPESYEKITKYLLK